MNGITRSTEEKIVNKIQQKRKRALEMKYQQPNNTKEPVLSPVEIEVLSSDDEDTENTPSKLTRQSNVNKGRNNKNGFEDKCIQTDSQWVQQKIENMVCSRMKIYAEAVRNKDHLDRRLSPLLSKLKQENAELHKQAQDLKERLDKYEQNHFKRTSNVTVSASSAKRSHAESCPGTTIPTATIPPLISKKHFSENQAISLQKGDFMQSSQMSLQQNIRPLPTIRTQTTLHAQQYHLVPAQQINASYPQRYITPNNVNPQSTPIYCYPTSERFMLVENQQANQTFNVSTQVVSANQGLRMASLPNDNRTTIQKNTYSTVFRSPPSNVSELRSYPPTVANLVRTNIQQPGAPTAFTNVRNGKNQRPIAQTQTSQDGNIVMNKSRVNQIPTQQKRIPAQNSLHPQNVPNIALPFNSLPKLKTSISAAGSGIILTWDYETSGDNPDKYKVECYQLFAYQAKNHTPRTQPTNEIKDWKKIGVVNALPLPMACTLTQFATGNVYYFAVVAIDIHGREGEMSNKCVIRLNLNP